MNDTTSNRSPAEERPHAQRLRGLIDTGKTHDKVRQDDPAAAPLGTDDEAAGSPPASERVQQAIEAEAAPIHDEDADAEPVIARQMIGPTFWAFWRSWAWSRS